MRFLRNLITITSFAGALLLTSIASAQEKKAEKPASPPPAAVGVGPNQTTRSIPDRATLLAQTLKLNDDQKAKLKTILDEELAQSRTLRLETNMTSQVRLAKIKEIRDGTTAKLKPVLTEEQFDKWQKMRNPSRGAPRPGAPAAPAPAPAAPPAK
jgi:uncharacterized protein YbaP (TraB family)